MLVKLTTGGSRHHQRPWSAGVSVDLRRKLELKENQINFFSELITTLNHLTERSEISSKSSFKFKDDNCSKISPIYLA